MPPHAIRHPAQRSAGNGRHLPSILALAHLLALLASRASGGWAAWAPHWAASAFVVLGCIIVRDFVTGRRRDRLPDIPSALAWAAAGALEIHALSKAVAASRIVPALLFPAVAFLLPASSAAAFAGTAAAWCSWSPGRGWPAAFDAAATLVLAVPGLWAGIAVRRALARSRAAPDLVRKAVDDSRSLLLPWEGEARGAETSAGSLDDVRLIGGREEAVDGIRRVLEGLLPMTGADVVLYVSAPAAPGRPFTNVVSVHGADAAFADGLRVPDTYVPVREATVFRRPFSASGEEAGTFRVAVGARDAKPTGVAAAPVAVGERVEGAVLAVRFGDGGLTEAAIPALEMGAFFAAREINANRRWYRARRHDGRHRALQDLVRKIAEVSEAAEAAEGETVSPRKEIYREAAVQGLAHLEAGRVLVVEADDRGKKGRLAASAGGRDGAVEEDEWIPLADSYAGWVIRQSTGRIFNGMRSAPIRHPVLPARWCEPGDDACLLVPVRGPGRTGGLIAFVSGEGRTFEARDVEAAQEVVRILKLGLSHALRLESLALDATQDGLTGLLNRKTFRERLASVMGRLDGRYPCAVLMLDLDHFKGVNDRFGHPAGDEVLKRSAGLIRKAIRKVDFAGRYGGEEFAIYLAHADRAHAMRVAERLCAMIRQMKFVFGGREVAVTASIGVACCPDHGRTADEIVGRADEALYRSKEGGRDRVTGF